MNNNVLTALLAKCKTALRVTTDAYNTEITDLIEACYSDLVMVNAIQDSTAANYPLNDAMIVRAIITYVKCYFGAPDNYEQLRGAYEQIKGQLKTATGYTNWESEFING